MIVGDVRREAREKMQDFWTTCVPVWFVFYLIIVIHSIVFGEVPFLGFLVALAITGPLTMGLTRIFLRVYGKEPVKLEQLFDGFKEFKRAFMAYLLISVYTFLWFLLLVVPGIIAGLSYSMTFLIMAEDPHISASDAIRKSKEMMLGHKWDLFRLQLSFIGWVFVSIITFGIGFLWLSSYIQEAHTVFYHRIKGVRVEIAVAQDSNPAI